MKLGNFDWRSLQKYFSPKAAADFNTFLENLPVAASKSVLIAVGVAWGCAGAVGLFTTVKIQELAEKRGQLEEMAAAQPSVPEVRNVPEAPAKVKEFADRAVGLYPDLQFASNGSNVTIGAADTRMFGIFREAIGHVQNGGAGWRVNIDNMCVGRQCGNQPLSATLKINKVSIESASQTPVEGSTK